MSGKIKVEISIIIPIYNAARYLRQCLESVEDQSYREWEAILVDDGSTDDSGAIAEEFARKNPRFRVIREENQGSGKARANGIKEARGEWFAFVDSDDYVEANFLFSMIDVAENEHADLILSAYYYGVDANAQKQENKPTSLDRKTVITETLYNHLHAGLWNKLFHRSIIEKVSFPPYSYYEDMVFWISALFVCKKLVYCPVAGYHYRENPFSLTNSQNVDRRVMMFEEMSKNMAIVNEQFHLSSNPSLREAFYHTINFNKILLIGDYYHYPFKLRKALRFFPESYAYLPTKTKSDKMCYLAVRYRFFLPFYLLEWKMKLHRFL